MGQPTTADLKFLLQQSRTNNKKDNITGVLLYGNGSFLQVLEGEAAAVQQRYATIRTDQRHMHVLTLADGPTQTRIFPDWTMGFQTLSGENFARLVGYINPYRSSFLDGYLPTLEDGLLVLLKTFVVHDGAQL